MERFEHSYNKMFSEDLEEELSKRWPQIEPVPLWHLGYYDGPISGISIVDGRECYFFQIAESRWKDCPMKEECDRRFSVARNIGTAEAIDDVDVEDICPDDINDCLRDWHRYYAYVPLSSDQFKRHAKSHRRFERYVGNHTSYDNWKGKNAPKIMHPERKMRKFYAEKMDFGIEKIELETHYDQIIGWSVGIGKGKR
jgi:hypothetical protein